MCVCAPLHVCTQQFSEYTLGELQSDKIKPEAMQAD